METIKRVVTGLVFAPLLIFAIFSKHYEGLVFFVIFFASSIFGIIEFKNIFKQKNVEINTSLLIVFILFSWSSEYFINYIAIPVYNINMWFIIIFFTILCIIEIFKKNFEFSLEKIGANLLIFIYLGILFPFTYKLKMISPNGPYLFFFLLIVTWTCDIFAYFVGKYLGKHKLNLPVSPNKSLEGFIGGALFSFGFAFLIRFLFRNELNMPIFKLKYFIPISILIIILTFLGDLIESVFKRGAKVKDSMKLFPGHGGVLDVFDSLILTSVTVYFILMISS